SERKNMAKVGPAPALYPLSVKSRLTGSELASDAQIFLSPVGAQFVAAAAGEILECIGDHRSGPLNDGIGIAVRAADGLGDDAVDDPQRFQVFGGDLHIGRRFLGAGAVAPQDRGGTFRRDDAVDRMF